MVDVNRAYMKRIQARVLQLMIPALCGQLQFPFQLIYLHLYAVFERCSEAFKCCDMRSIRTRIALFALDCSGSLLGKIG